MKSTMILLAVAGLASGASAQDFYSQGAFQTAAVNAGLFQFAFEDLEGSTPGYSIVGFDDPLQQGVPQGPFLSGLVAPIIIQSNINPGNPNGIAPQGVDGLAAVEFGAGFGETSDIVLSNTFVNGLDIIIPGGAVGAGFNVVDIFGNGSVQIGVYDTNDVFLGAFNSGGDAGGSNFFGYVSAGGIGRLNVYSVGGGAEGGDNIELWNPIPAPGSIALLGMGGLLAARRRRA
jgi:hypothetical protein